MKSTPCFIALAPRFSPLFVAILLSFPFSARADVSVMGSGLGSVGDLDTAIVGSGNGDNITYSAAGTNFPSTHIAITVTRANLTLRGSTASGFASGIAGLNSSILSQARSNTSASAASLSAMAGGLTVTYSVSTDGVTLSYIHSDGSPRTVTGHDFFFNASKLLSVPATGAGGLSLENLRFSDVTVAYENSRIVNGLIGNINTAMSDSSLGNLRGNAFVGLTVSLRGTVDTQYMAGGALIGIRSVEGTASIGDVSGNVFKGLRVNITDSSGSDSGMSLTSAYLEGGGIIGVDGVSSPADKVGRASIASLSGNLFTDIRVHSGDILIGGGLVGANNNSKNFNLDTLTGTFASLRSVEGNVFGNGAAGDIDVNIGQSIRGGGVIGVNGLSNAAVSMEVLRGNVFNGINVETTSYLKGGGVVGLQTQYVENDLGGKDDDTNDYPGDGGQVNDEVDKFLDLGVTATDEIVASLTNADDNLFLNTRVTTGRYLYGGGIIGLRANAGAADLFSLTGNIFKGLYVNVGMATGGDLNGGGIVGVSSGRFAQLGSSTPGIDNNYFDDLHVTVNGALNGGGIVGAQSSDTVANEGFALAGDVTNNTFRNLEVATTGGDINGGGVIGVNGLVGMSGFSDILDNSFDSLSVTSSAALSGGGIVGAYSSEGIATMHFITHNAFTHLNIAANGNIAGGGVVGALSGDVDGMALIQEISQSRFTDNNISSTAGNIDGGIVGIRAARGAMGLIDASVFQANTITADGDVRGGLFFSSGLAGGLTISDSQFTNNLFSAGGRVFGAMAVDTSIAPDASDPDHNVLTLRASAGHTTLFDNNAITDGYSSGSNNIAEGNSRRNSLYFGALSGPSQADATLNIDAQAGGSVVLNDPLRVEQNNNTFTLNVTGQGDFLWGGDNIFNVSTVGGGNAVNLQSGSKTTLQTGFRLDAVNHDFNVNDGGRLNVMGANEMWVNQANLNGDLYFNLAGTTVNDASAPLLKIHAAQPNATVAGGTVILGDIGADAPKLKAGDEFYLIETDGDDYLSGDPANGHVTARQGLTTRYNFVIDKNPTGVAGGSQWLVARLLAASAAPQTKVLLEGRSASLAFLGQRGSWLADHSYQSADMAFAGHDNGRSWTPFAGADVSWLRVDTSGGSRLYIDAGTTALVGAATRDKNADRTVLLGAFIEGGYADYRTRDKFPDETIKGRGKLESLGGGLMGRVEWTNGTRIEGSLRAGEQKNKFHSRDYQDVDGTHARYKFTSPYQAAHVGLAHTWQVDEKNNFDLLGRYFWLRQQGGHTTLSTGERIEFKDDESRRLRVGGRLTHVKDVRTSWYGGVALEHEFDGRARGNNADGYRFDSPELKGTSGVFDVGVIIRPAQDKPYSIETGLQAYVGKIRGVSGGVRIGREF
ncbi:MAG: autotransporter outer membrane beta-barrel domain-containing protein [Azoarcus sp.]|jgi:hypothetical protein|nr:autotransporter outer membrane beta-barrel domain-containing protein [Azoarcus sp.]